MILSIKQGTFQFSMLNYFIKKIKNYFCASGEARLIVYGDIHGCLNELKSLREKIKPTKNDIEVCVGDIITKGYDSIGVLDYLIQNNIKSVLGNHEDKILRYLEHEKSKKKNPMTLDEDEEKNINNLTKRHLNYLKSLPVFFRHGDITVVHAGLQNHTKLDELSKHAVQKVIRLRYVDEKGDFVEKGKENSKSSFWADVYDGNEGFVIHGHRWDKTVNIHPNAIGIDTGCVYGNLLSAIVMKDKYDYRIVQQEGYKS